MSEKAVPVLYLDIDGTVRQGKDDALGRFVNGPEDVRVFPAARVMMRRWKAGGGRIVGVSNQGGIALGHTTPRLVAAAMAETHQQAEELFDKIAYCKHHPDAKDPEMARCWCRKPAPGLLIEAALELARQHHEYYPPYMGLMVGDREEDLLCAERAGLDFQWAAEWRAQARSDSTHPDVPAPGRSGEELDLEPPTFTMQPVPGRPGVVRPVLDKPLIPWLSQGLSGEEPDHDDLAPFDDDFGSERN